MKILIITTSYPCDDTDPSGIFVKRLALALVEQGAKITVLAPGDTNAQSRETVNGIHIVRFCYAPGPFMKIGYGAGGIPVNLRRWPWLFAILPFFLASMVIHAIILAKDCDVIHANWLAAGFFSLPAKLIRRKPLVLTLRGSDLRKGTPKLLPFILKRADAVTTVNKKWARDLRDAFQLNAVYTPNGVEVSGAAIDPKSAFGIGAHEIIVLFVGALHERKGADILFKAARILMGRDDPVKFLVIGPGDPDEFGLNALPNVICTGGIPPNEVLTMYSRCDIFIIPSRFEGRPNVLLEAMASGLPSVATRLPGIMEVLTDESGILIDIEDARALADGICALAKDPERREFMGQKAKARISELSLDWQSSAGNYLHIFQEVCSS